MISILNILDDEPESDERYPPAMDKIFLAKGENWEHDPECPSDPDFWCGPVGDNGCMSDGFSINEWLGEVLADVPEVTNGEIGASENYHLLKLGERSRDKVWYNIVSKISAAIKGADPDNNKVQIVIG